MIPNEDSEFIEDLLELEVLFNQIRDWTIIGLDLKKSDVCNTMRRICARAGSIECKTKIAGWDYWKVKA